MQRREDIAQVPDILSVFDKNAFGRIGSPAAQAERDAEKERYGFQRERSAGDHFG
jgi:hypothetical protein